MLGYREVAKSCDEDRNTARRVILLTDGLANRGVTDAEQIARHYRDTDDQDLLHNSRVLRQYRDIVGRHIEQFRRF